MRTPDQPDIARLAAAEEGQFFERKSALDRSGARPKQRKAADIARDIAETLAAMANADGGELVIGVEDDGALSGVPHAQDKLRLLLGVPRDRNYVNPVLPCQAREVDGPDGKKMLHFEVDWSPDVHLLADSRCLLRVDDTNSPFASDKVAALKAAKAQGLLERSFPPGARLDDLNLELVAHELGEVWPGLSPEDALRRYGLIAGRNGQSVPTLAALLLFGREPTRWHPRCGLDFIRWEGTASKTGAELNIAKRFRIEEPLAVLIRKAREAIQPFIRERQQLHDLFFVEKLEYPTFAWQEAIVNAVAHRDYSLQGAPIEVWMYDDRMEIRSPGSPPAPVTIEALNRRKRVHFSRNPMLVRVLSDLQYMRDVGEGVPRIFDEMDRAGCYPPRFEMVGGFVFQVTLRNEPIYDRKTLEWLKQFAEVELSGDQKRMLAYAHAHGDRFTSREFQKVIGTDIYGASNAIKDMIRKGVSRSTAKGSRVYEVSEPLRVQPDMPEELGLLLPLLQKKGRLTNRDFQGRCRMTKITAARLLRDLTQTQWLTWSGKRGAGAWYAAGPRLLSQSQTRRKSRETDTMGRETDTMDEKE
ncbi:MAG: putative DNA binding domain-containing protein [Verrucomicrobia bacterium]|nr:putative DNA binding domain-containing protein [Verrucomicrobiota bacterium]